MFFFFDQDIDDALSVRELRGGDVEIGVHIADVTYFVKHETPLDLVSLLQQVYHFRTLPLQKRKQ